jgi:PAP2 superfamily
LRGFLASRPKLWVEAAVLLWLLWLYDQINNLSSARLATALAHTRQVLVAESSIHVDLERSLNLFAASHHLFGLVMADYYDVGHFAAAIIALVSLWLFRPANYRNLRRALIAINLIGFATFWLWPMAPPRLLPGFADIVASTHAIGSWHTGTLADAANQYAAMPSLHMSWALWSTIAIWTCTRRPALRAVAALHPVITLVAVLCTANHLLIDAAAGIATTCVAVALFRLRHPAGPPDREQSGRMRIVVG